MTRLTVFTPAYNRARTLPRLFESLACQGTSDFEWLIVDDGSTDNTRSVVTGWEGWGPFIVRYLYQPNQGKHAAMNAGVQAARGELFWTVDSDDWLPKGSIARMLEIWDDIKDDERADIVALTGLCVSPQGRVIGDPFPASPMQSNSLEMSYIHRVSGDKSGWTKTEVMRQFPFPEGEHKFIPEGIVWNAIALRYRTLYVNVVTLVVEYQEDGLSAGLGQANPIGLALYQQSLLNDAGAYLIKDPWAFARAAASYSRFSRAAGIPWATLLRRVRHAHTRILVLTLSPVGWWLRRRDRRIAGGPPVVQP